MREKIVALAFVLFAPTAIAQKFDEKEFEAYKAKYPDDQAIFLKYFQDIDISISGDSLVVNSTKTQEILHLRDQSNVYAKDGIYSSTFYETGRIEAKTLVPDKKKYREVPVTEFKESYDKNSSVFYDDTKYINFYYPAVQPGAITSLVYEQKIKDARFISSFLFQNYLPIAHSRFSITADAGVALQLDVLHDVEGWVKVTERKNGDRITYTFEAYDTRKLKIEEDAPPIRYTAPHVVPLIKHFQKDSEQVNILSSADDLFAWYRGFITGLKKADHENIQAILKDLITPQDTELEKVRKIFYWVQNNIKYIAFEDGMRGLIPHNAGYVCDKRYGDCKDMATIVVNMLHEAGVDAHFTWIGTRDIPYKYTDYPSPLVDNHMIATYIDGDRYYFLDATSQYSSFELPSSMIQGKQALIALSETEFEIKEVPVIKKQVNLRKDTTTIYLDNGNVKGKGQLTLSGYPKVFNSFKMIKSSKKGTDDHIESILERGNNKFFVEQYEISNLDDLDTPIQVDYEFRIEDYYREISDKIYFNMNLDKQFASKLIDKDREQPVEYEFRHINESTTAFTLPAGFEINRLPENTSFENELFGFDITYTIEQNTIYLKRSYFVNSLLIYPSDFERWNEGIKKLNDAYRGVIILEKSGT